MKQALALFTMFLFLVPLTTSAQDFCEGNFDYDEDVDGTDAAVFKLHFGRSAFKNPCPADGPAPVEKTNQIISYATGDDGDHQRGVPFPQPRFTDHGDGTVTDNLTGLMWTKNANLTTPIPEKTWQEALDFVASMNEGGGTFEHTDWRVPNRKELLSLVDLGQYDPALPLGHPFENASTEAERYCTSTTYALFTDVIWYVQITNGYTALDSKTDPYLLYHVWPVRGGH